MNDLEYITEPMLSALFYHDAVLRLKATLVTRDDSPVWEIAVKFRLPDSKEGVKRLFTPSAQHDFRVQPPSFVSRLEELAVKGQSLVWGRLVTYRQATSGNYDGGRSVVDLDRFIKRLSELGAKNLTIDIYLVGDSA